VNGPDSLTTQVSGLTNGTPYEFEVSAVRATAGAGPASNRVVATPFGQIGAPVVTAEGGDGEVRLFWTEPPAGGHPGPLSYTVVYRPVGTTDWLAGPGFVGEFNRSMQHRLVEVSVAAVRRPQRGSSSRGSCVACC
jgi:hypothetical protein